MFYCPHIYSNYMKEIKKTIRITKKFGRLQILSNLSSMKTFKLFINTYFYMFIFWDYSEKEFKDDSY